MTEKSSQALLISVTILTSFRSSEPRSIEDLAICIALPRPGKAHLINKPRSEINREIWMKTDNYYFKKSHAIAYASAIVVQLNLMIEQANAV